MTEQATTPHAAGLDAGAAISPDAPKPAARWEDFVDIFYAPSQVFARRENSGFGLPMLVVTLLGAAIFLAAYNAMSPMFDAEMGRAAANALKKGMSPERAESMRHSSGLGPKIAIFILPPIMIMLTGLTLWICGKMVGARQTVAAATMVAAFANVPRVIGGLIGAAQALLMDPSSLNSHYAISLSPARFLDPDGGTPMLLAMLSRIDVFTIWATILLAIGLAVTGKIPRSKAAIAAVLVWVIGTLPQLVGAAFQ